MKRMNGWIILALILIALGGVGAILLAIQQFRSSSIDTAAIIRITEEQKEDLETRLSGMQTERDNLSKTLAKRDSNIQKQNKSILFLTKKLTEQSEKLQDQSEKLQDQSEYIQNYVTGGNGYPYVFPRELTSDSGRKFYFDTKNNFEVPLYNIELRIHDVNMLEESIYKIEGSDIPYIKTRDYQKSRIVTKSYSEIPPNTTYGYEEEFEYKEGQQYYIQMVCRNQTVIQHLVIVKFEEDLHYGFQIFNSKKEIITRNFNETTNETLRSSIIKALEEIPKKMKFTLVGK